jgi:hypothetical protein
MRTTEFARTKMTALTTLAALYPPLPPQKWNPALEWQPIPYDTKPADTDDVSACKNPQSETCFWEISNIFYLTTYNSLLSIDYLQLHIKNLI